MSIGWPVLPLLVAVAVVVHSLAGRGWSDVTEGNSLSTHREGVGRGWDSGTRSATSPLCLVSNLLLLVELCHGRMHIYAVNYNL